MEHCIHSYLYSKLLQYDNLVYIDEILSQHRLPLFRAVSMDTYLKAYLDYWDDSKVIEEIPKAMNDGVVDGKTVRLCNNTNEYVQPKLPQKYIYQDMLTLGEKFEEFREDSLE
ncbi:hypothetical protein ACTFIY_001470 [Dictyostelium cf. discoideum]